MSGPTERKSIELYVQSANWIGGIAAASSGAVLLALINENVPPSLIVWLRWIGGALLVALGASMYVQLHAISVLSGLERENAAESAEIIKRRKFTRLSQTIMISAMLGVSVLLVAGLVTFKPNSPHAPEWTVAGVSSTGTDSVVVLTKAESQTLRIVSRQAGEAKWRVDEVPIESTAPPKK